MIRKIIFSIVVFFVFLTGALYFAQRNLIFPAPQERLASPPQGYRFVETQTSDGLRLRAAFRPAVEGKATLLFFHGNGDNLEGADSATQILTKAGYGALLVEYRGYGGNPGSPSEEGFYKDGEAAIAWLKGQGIIPGRLVIIGNSIGSGPATEMAVRHRPAALVLVSPFASLPDAVSGIYPFIPTRLLLRDRFDNAVKIGGVKTPMLILHGDADTLVGPANSQQLKQAAPKAMLVMISGKGHELAYLPEGQQPILDWLAKLGA